MTVVINGTTGYSGPVGVLGDLTTTGNTILGDQSTDTLNVANGNLVLNSSGNAGLGVTPSAWVAPIKALQINTTGALWANSATIFLTNNTFSDGTDKYLTTAAATRYYQSAGSHIWDTAASGTAGNAVTFTQTMTLDASGNLLLGTTSLPSGGGIVTASSSAAETKVSIVNTGTSGRHYWLGSTNTSSGSLGGGKFAIFDQTANAARAVIDSSGNVGIGQTSPAYKLDIRNDVPASTSLDPTTIYMYNNSDGGSGIQFLNGVGGKSKISFGVESTGAGTDDTYIGFSTSVNGGALTERARITSGGTLVIGATSGAGLLTLGGSGALQQYFISSSATSQENAIISLCNNGALYSKQAFDALNYDFKTSGTSRLQIAATGNVLVSSSASFETTYSGNGLVLSKHNVGAKNAIVSIGDTSSTLLINNSAAGWDNVAIYTAGSERARFNASGDLGIGRTDPPMRLSAAAAGAVISGTATIGTNMQGIQVYNTNSAITNNAVGIWFPTGPHQAGIASFRADAATGWDTTLAFYTHGAATTGLTDCYERMRVTGEGQLAVGFAGGSFGEKIAAQSSSSYVIGSYRTGTGNEGQMVFTNGNGAVGTIFTNGSSTAYNTSSDYRLKNTIAPMTGALARVAQLKPVTYKWNVDGSNGEGFIAHELAEVVPQAVTGEKDAVDEDGKPQYQGIDVSFLVATLTAAIQELKSELDSVKTELAALKGN